LFERGSKTYQDDFRTKHDEISGSWEIPFKNRYSWHPYSFGKFGTPQITALAVLEKTLNLKTPDVYDEVPAPDTASKKRRVLNKEETAIAMERQKALIEEFRSWIWKDPQRTKKLTNIFEEKFGFYRTRRYNGDFLDFPGMSDKVSLYPHQRSAVARILFSPNVLLAHDVGSGKTYEMIAAAMELRRMGASSKNMFVVPNNIIGQWLSIAKEMYPSGNFVTVEPKDFTPSKRTATLIRLRDGDFDGIIMAYSCFDRLPLSNDYLIERYEDELSRINQLALDRSKNTAALKETRTTLARELDRKIKSHKKYDMTVTFDSLGVTRLFVDEAHNYKNLPVGSGFSRYRGISDVGSVKCKEMLDKVRYIQRNNGGGGVVFATGTPITNSITDAFAMQYYLQSGELSLLELESFEAWVGMFAEPDTQFEIDVDTNTFKMVTRLSKFHNLTELTSILSSIADFHICKNGDTLPQFLGYTDVMITKNKRLDSYLKEISKRADLIHNGKVPRTEDNMLKITGDGRKAALDVRLVDPKAPPCKESKVYKCATTVSDIYNMTANDRLTQLVFCDVSTPGKGFNVYDDLASLLVSMGVRRDEIAYVHDAETDKQREELFSKVRSGKIRVLLGSTVKLGTGVNVQDKLIAIHHLDVPWRPSDMVQREGRIIRPGNQNERVFVYRYVTEGSFDSYSWQLLEIKQRFISNLLSGSLSEREGADVDAVVLNYAEVKALAVGNPLIKRRVELANELATLHTLQRKSIEARDVLEKELAELPIKIKSCGDLLNKINADSEHYASTKYSLSEAQRKTLRNRIYEALMDNVMQESERVIATYQGFDVVLPDYMIPTDPYVVLRRESEYRVSMGELEKGVLTRIDNCLESLPERVTANAKRLLELKRRKRKATETLRDTENYYDKIEECRAKLARVDKKLGVTKDDQS